jgi:hypothetical protein
MKPVASDFGDSLSVATPEMSFGTIFGQDIPAFLATLDLSLRSQTKYGFPYYVVTGRPSDQSFDIELGFDSTRGNSLAYINYVSHLAYDANKEDSQRQLNFDWSVRRFQKSGSVFVPADVTLRVFIPSYQVDGPEGRKVAIPPAVDVFDSALVSIDFSPKLSAADLEPSIVVPNGAPVYMTDAMHLRFEWRDGIVVPSDAEAMKTLRASRFLGGSRSLRIWLTVVVVLLLIWCFAIRRWHKPRAGTV